MTTETEDATAGPGAEFPATRETGGDAEAESRGVVTTKSAHFIDYDTDDDGLIDISSLAQLDAVRHDLDGDGTPSTDGETAYAAAFPNAGDGMGCPTADGCSGYELMADLDFDTNGSGRADTGDTYWNDGQGWVPIGGAGSSGNPARSTAVTRRNPFHAIFEGNGRTIANLFAHSEDALFTGLFGYAGYDSVADSYSIIRRVGMIGVELSGYNYIGGLVGWNEGAILSSYATGQVSGRFGLGGLVGRNQGSIVSSYATVRLFGRQIFTQAIGGLAGTNETTSGRSNGGLPESRRGLVAGSYATGRVQAYNIAGGLVGNNDGTITACYATGRVFDGGGLVGRNSGTISFSYSTGQASSLSLPDDALVHLNFGPTDFSYFDSRTTLWYVYPLRSTREKTTEQLQEPTDYTGLYQLWDVDLDGDNSPDDPWHFGTTSQYPVLRADLDGDGRATWQEFGYQIREGPTLSATTAVSNGNTQVDLSWTSVDTGHWNPAPPVTYTLRRDTSTFSQLGNIAEGLNALRYTDTVTPRFRDSTSSRYAYQVAAVVSGGEATHSVPSVEELPDTKPPEVSRFGFDLSGPEDTHPAGFLIEVFIAFNENVQVTGQPRLTLELGGEERTANFSSGDGSKFLYFSYTVAAEDMDTDGMSIPSGRIDLNGGTIEDEAGNPAMLEYPGVEPQLSHKVDGDKPLLLGAAVNQTLLALTYDEALDVRYSLPHTDDFVVEVGGAERSVSRLAVNGGVVELTLATAVGSGDTGITVSYTQGSNPIRDLARNHADALSDQPVTNTTGASNAAPAFTGSAAFTTLENRTEPSRLTAVDSDDGDEITGWAISGGADRNRFSIDEVTGDLGFSQGPDYEMPADQASPAGDNEYVVRVSVTSGTGSRALMAEREIRVTVEDEDEPPGVPEVSPVVERTVNSLQVTWTEPDNSGPAITGYVVRYRKLDGVDYTEVQAGTGLEWTLTGLEEDMAYEVQVQAINDEGAGPWSESVLGRTDAPLTVEITSLEASPVEGSFTLRIAFSETVTGFDSNDIEIQVETGCTDSGNNPLYCIPGRGTLRYPSGAGAFSGPTFGLTLTPRTDEVAGNYTLGIRIPAGSVQSNAGDHSNSEATLQVRVLVPGATAPEPISSLDLEASPGTRSVMLSWNLPSDDGGSAIVRYEYRYAAVGEGLGPWKSVGAEELGVRVGNLAGGREHVFEVRAVNGLGKGPIETVMATPRAGGGFGGGGGGGGGLLFPPEAPAALMATAGDERVRLEWSPPENDGGSPIQRYEYRLKEGRGEFGEWTPIPDSAVEEVNASGYTVSDLLNGTVYAFELRAVNAAGNGQESESVEVTMPLDPAWWSNFRAEDLEGTQLMLEAFLLEGNSRDRELRFGEGLRFEQDELDGEGEVTATHSGSYGYRYTSRTTGELSLDFDGGEACQLRLTFSGEGAGSYSYRCGGSSRGQGSFRMSELMNRVPEITSTGPFEVEENQTEVVQLQAVDWDEKDEVTGYEVAGGADGSLFTVDARTGALSFREAPDYESPGDVESEEPQSAAADNEYILVVEVTSGEGDRERSRQQAIRVRVTDVEMEDAVEEEMEEDEKESLFVPVILSSAGRNRSFFTSELTLTNRGEQEVELDYTYTSRDEPERRSGTASEVLSAGSQKIETDALDYLRDLGIPIPETGNQLGTLRVEVPPGSEVEAVVRTTTLVPDGRAGLAYLGVAEEEGFGEPVYLCGLRQNSRDRSNVAFQNMGTSEEGAITLKTTVYSGEAADTTARELDDVTLEPGGFHQYSGLLGSVENGYVKVERVEGEAPFYAYGVINDQGNSDGSFVFPVTAGSLEGKRAQTLPVIVETRDFTSELTVTNFSQESRTLEFEFVSEQIQGEDKKVGFSMTLEAGEQEIIPELVEELRRAEMAKLGASRGFYLGPLFVTAKEGDLSGIVIGARTGSQGGGGRYSVFYNAVPEGEGFEKEAWVDGLQQNEENRSNLALVNTGEVDGSESVFHLEIYNGETGLLEATVVTKPIPARGWHQIDGILLRANSETRQGYIRIEKVSGENPFLAYGVVNDGGSPGQRSGDGAYLPAWE